MCVNVKDEGRCKSVLLMAALSRVMNGAGNGLLWCIYDKITLFPVLYLNKNWTNATPLDLLWFHQLQAARNALLAVLCGFFSTSVVCKGLVVFCALWRGTWVQPSSNWRQAQRNAALSCMGVPRASWMCTVINSIALGSVLLHNNKHGAT